VAITGIIAVEPVVPEYSEVRTYSISLIIVVVAIASSLGTAQLHYSILRYCLLYGLPLGHFYALLPPP
jgi:hypothetical protein